MEDWDVFWGDDSLPRCVAKHQSTLVRAPSTHNTCSIYSLPSLSFSLLSSSLPLPLLAPEVLMGEEESMAADMWALGATLFIL